MVNPSKVTERLFRSPSKYIQGPYAIQNAAKHLGPLGKAPLLICDDVVWGIGKCAYMRPPPHPPDYVNTNRRPRTLRSQRAKTS